MLKTSRIMQKPEGFMSERHNIAELQSLYFGRLDIYTSADEITEENVLREANLALAWHAQNVTEENYLYWYRRGDQPILDREKKRNKYVNNKIVENHAEEIVAFKNGYFLNSEIMYIARNDDAQDGVKDLNEYLYRSGKIDADTELVNWFHEVGKGCLLVEPGTDDEIPVVAYALDPRKAFVVYSSRPSHEPMMGINAVAINDMIHVDVYTKDKVYRLIGSSTFESTSTLVNPISQVCTQLVKVEKNVIGEVPMVEYRYNSQNMAAFEAAIPLLDLLNQLASDRLDGIDQFIQSLTVIYNADLPEGETVDTLKASGLLLLKSTGDQKSDIKILSEQLNQSQTQEFVDYVYQQILTICEMPVTQFGQKSSSDNQGAVLARNGWYQADASAQNTEKQFRKSNRYFDRIFLKLLKERGLSKLSLTDFELQFSRNETSNIVAKSQAAMNLASIGLHPALFLGKSGVSNDPLGDYEMSKPWMDAMLNQKTGKYTQDAQTEQREYEREQAEKQSEQEATEMRNLDEDAQSRNGNRGHFVRGYYRQ